MNRYVDDGLDTSNNNISLELTIETEKKINYLDIKTKIKQQLVIKFTENQQQQAP